MLPIGQAAAFTDVKSGAAKQISGSMALSVQNTIKKHQMGVVMQHAIAKTLPGVEPENVAITKITVSNSRRLGATKRQLAAGKVSVEYTIITPPTYSGPTITKDVIKAKEADMKTTIASTATDLGMSSVVVTAVEPATVKVTEIKVTTTTTMPAGGSGTDG